MSAPAIPNVRRAKLPGVYVEAQRALAECQKIDECKEWADKAAAIASYAKQAQDETLMATATRIKARAIRRCGELLKAIEKAQGANQNIRDGSVPKAGRAAAATRAGLSERQRKDALRVANLPAAEFESAVESEKPPTVTELSEAGKRAAKNREYLSKPKPEGFREATKLIGSLERFAQFCESADPAVVADALSKREAKGVLRDTETVSVWLRKLKRSLG